MYKFLFLLAVSLSITACKETAGTKAAPPSASVYGELHFRSYCTTGTRALVYTNPPAIVYVTDETGALVGSPVNAFGGRFRIAGITRTGTLQVRVIAGGTGAFYAAGSAREGIPVTIDTMTAHAVGPVCIDNDAPRLEGLIASYSTGITSVPDAANVLRLPRQEGPINLRALVNDPGEDDLKVRFYAADGTLASQHGRWTWNLSAVQNAETTLRMIVDDGSLGRLDQTYRVRLFDRVLMPQSREQRYDFSQSADRNRLRKEAANDSGRWTFSSCCLVAVQYQPQIANRLQAIAPQLVYTGAAVTAETAVTVQSLNGFVSFGLRISGTTHGPTIDALLSNASGRPEWSLSVGEHVLAGGPLQEKLVTGHFKLKVTYEPLHSLLTFDVRNAAGDVTGVTLSTGTPMFDIFQVALVAENAENNGEGATYLSFQDLGIQGADPDAYQVFALGYPATAGSAVEKSAVDPSYPVVAVLESGYFEGEGTLRIPIRKPLLRALVEYHDGQQVTVYADAPERLEAWLPVDAAILSLEKDAVAGTAVPFAFLY